MGEVDDADVGRDARDHRVADADEVVLVAVVGEEGDHRVLKDGADDAFDVVSSRLDVGLEPVLAQRGGGHRADGDDARVGARRAAGGVEEVGHGRGRGEGDVVGLQRGGAGVGVELLGHGLVEGQHVDAGAALAQRVGEDVAGLGGAGDQRAGDGDGRQRLDQRLGHRALGHDVGLDAVLAQGAGGARPDGGDGAAVQGAGVHAGGAQAFKEQAHAVGRGQADEVGAVEVGGVAGQGDDADGGRLDDLGAERAQPGGQAGGLRAGPRHGDAPAVQGAVLEPAQTLGQGGDGADDGDRGRAYCWLRSPRRRWWPAWPSTVRWPGRVPRSITAAGSSDARPALAQRVGDAGQGLDAHVEDERAREACQRLPVQHRLRLVGILVAGDEGDGAGGVAVGDGDAGVGGRGDACGDAGHDLVADAGRAAGPRPPRRRGRTRRGRRP